MQTFLFYIISLALGVMLAVYMPMNSSVAHYLGSTLAATITFFGVALFTASIVFIGLGQFDAISQVKEVPPWLFLTGVFSVVMVFGTTYLIPRIGLRHLFILTVTGQIIAALVIGHLGLLNVPKDPVSTVKIIGAALVIVGAILSTVPS
jgi:transporter family-2 protein